MFFLILSILSFIAFSVLLWRFKRSQVKVVEGPDPNIGKKTIVMLDDDEIFDEAKEEIGDGRLKKAYLGCLVSAVLFFALFVVMRSPEKVHNVLLSYEGFALYRFGEELTAYYPEAAASAIDTLIIAPDPESNTISELITQLTRGLSSENFKIMGVFPVNSARKSKTAPVITSEELGILIEDYPEIDLVILLLEFRVDDSSWGAGRPRIAVFSARSEYNANIALFNRGLIDLALISKGGYADRSIIPDNLPLETIFNENFLVINPVNLKEIVKEYKQTVSANPGADK